MTDKIFEKTNPHIFNGNLESWMTHLPPVLKNLPIIQLAIPGSHNTMTYGIKRSNDVGPDKPKWLRVLSRFFSFISKPIIYNWSVTQYEDVTIQLNGGIRYLDLRLATKSSNNESIYFVHGLYGSEVTEPLESVDHWLTAHPEEVVLLDCQHFYEFTKENHRYFVDKIKRIFGNKICPATRNLVDISLSWLNERKYQVLVIYRNEIAAGEKHVWPSGLWPTPWPDTVDPDKMLQFLELRIRNRTPNVGFVSQCLLTPNSAYVVKHLWGSLYRDLATLCRNASLPWIRQHKPGILGLNVVITDFIAYDNYLFSRTVIQRNNELLRTPQTAHSP
ncbi:PI-PLC X domain-containing protein 3 [Venturia canescens]|uniref:PI-PLC X domain-containing protein 3 n=1 Tax=Venturia canescens TaxID=32260 RepID=UPI001C9D39E0|nr:PI-PLC X domain-containing protein 3 [Venturia canescens]